MLIAFKLLAEDSKIFPNSFLGPIAFVSYGAVSCESRCVTIERNPNISLAEDVRSSLRSV